MLLINKTYTKKKYEYIFLPSSLFSLRKRTKFVLFNATVVIIFRKTFHSDNRLFVDSTVDLTDRCKEQSARTLGNSAMGGKRKHLGVAVFCLPGREAPSSRFPRSNLPSRTAHITRYRGSPDKVSLRLLGNSRG